MSAQNPFSPDALREQIQKLPPEQGGIGAVATKDDVGVTGSVTKDLGKGWSVAATGQWFKEAGYAVAGWLTWKGTK